MNDPFVGTLTFALIYPEAGTAIPLTIRSRTEESSGRMLRMLRRPEYIRWSIPATSSRSRPQDTTTGIALRPQARSSRADGFPDP